MNTPRPETPAPEKITIIEGPPPEFEARTDQWVLGVGEGARPYRTALTRLRTFNGPALVERCYRAWKRRAPVWLEYRAEDTRRAEALILAARTREVPEGHVLILWLRLPLEVEAGVDWGEDPGQSAGPKPSGH
jgi:hypothetical protein